MTTCVKSLQPETHPSLSVQDLHRGQTQRRAVPPATPVAHWEREPKPPAHRTAVCHSSRAWHKLTAVAQSLGYIRPLLAGRMVQDTHGPSQESDVLKTSECAEFGQNLSRTMPAREASKGCPVPRTPAFS